LVSYERVPYDSCPLCDSTEFNVMRKADAAHAKSWREPFPREIEWCQCENCYHVFTSGTWGAEAENELYAEPDPHCEVGALYDQWREASANTIGRVAKYMPRHSRPLWCDVGFGNGALIMTAHEFGYQVHGVERCIKNVDRIKSILGIELNTGHGIADASRLLYNVVSYCDVLEHMRYPKSELLRARRNVEPGAALLVSCPAYDAPVWRLMGDPHPYWCEFQHYHNFSRWRLYKLLKECGFEPLEYAVSQRYRGGMEIIARAC
jgi:hypothetical protein